MVCTAAVEALRDLASPRAVPLLREELRRAEGRGWDLEYGSAVIAALRAVDNDKSRAAAGGYADLLTARMPKDPAARHYYTSKIAEAREAAGRGG
jgi:hypothetical protein